MFRILALSGVCAGLVFLILPISASTKSFDFPRYIKFHVSGGPGASFVLEFTEDPHDSNNYMLKMKNFVVLGATSQEVLYTVVDKKSLSLRHHTVMPNEKAVAYSSQLRFENDCESAMDKSKTTCFIYQEGEDRFQTEIFAEYEGIDLLSSMLVATKLASEDANTKPYNFLMGTSNRQVILERQPGEASTSEESQKGILVVLKDMNTNAEFYRIYIFASRKGYYPAKVVFDSDRGRIELTAEDPEW